MELNADKATDFFEACIRHNAEIAIRGMPREEYLCPMAEGEPGCGKTTAMREAARRVAADTDFIEYLRKEMPDAEGAEFVSRTIILAQFEATDIGGLPWASNGKMIRLRPEMLPEDGIGCINFDEVRKAKSSVHNVLSQILHEGRVGEHKIAPGYSIFLASNRRQDRSGDIELPSHVLDRVTLFQLIADRESWLKYAMRKRMHDLVVFFVKSNPQYFNKKDEGELVHPTPRSYEQVSSILNVGAFNGDNYALRTAMEGKLGKAAGHAMYSFASLREKLPDPDYVLANPMKVIIPPSAQAQYAMMASISGVVKRETTEGLRKFLERFTKEIDNGMELSAFVIRSIMARDNRILTTPDGRELVGSYHSIISGEN